MKLRCPRCQQKLSVPDKFAGKGIRCPSCNRAFTVPKAKVAATGPGADGGLDLEGLARLESKSTEMDAEELTAVEAEVSARQAAQAAAESIRTCPNCNKKVKIKDPYAEILCSHCWQPIPPLAKPDASYADAKIIQQVRSRSVGFYAGLSTSLAYPFQAFASLLLAVGVAIGVILVPVVLMTSVAQALQQSEVGTEAGVQAADLSLVQILVRSIFAFEVLFFSAVGVHAFLDVIRTTSIGQETPPSLVWNPTQWGKSIVAYVSLVGYYLVMTYLVLILNYDDLDVVDLAMRPEQLGSYVAQPGVLIGLFIISFIVPMNLIGISLGSVAQGINPGNVFKSILGTHAHYLFLVVMLCVYGSLGAAAFLMILDWFIPKIDQMTGGAAAGRILDVALGLLAWGVVMGFAFVLTYVLGRLHGLFARSFRKKLLFGER